jgi:hypothetical protein
VTRRGPFAILLLAAHAFVGAAPAAAQGSPELRAADLRSDLFAIAHDSMGGRDTGEPGNFKAAEWVAASFRRSGLQPAGENGTFFQTLPFVRIAPDTTSRIVAGDATLAIARDFLPVGAPVSVSLDGVVAVYGGAANDPSTWPAAERTAGRFVVLTAGGSSRAFVRGLGRLMMDPRLGGAAGIAVAQPDLLPPGVIAQAMGGSVTTDTTVRAGKPLLLVTPSAATVLLGAEPGTLSAGAAGRTLRGRVGYARGPLCYPARNVVAILPGRDPALRSTYVSLSAHNDHLGVSGTSVDHDSTRAHNRVVRPAGADSPNRPATAEERVRIRALRDSLRTDHAPRPDSIYNGADDDGSGTVTLVEVARALAAGPRPRRSVLFVSHAAEERGLLGSEWYTDHPTVPRDSIVGEIDMDMVGRGTATDLAGGGPEYLEVVGSKRLSTEFGTLLEAANGRLARPFRFNFEYDAPGHPLQYYCRGDHYSYARYGIPSVSLSRGEHLDYHQVTDEPEYIDYQDMARVGQLVLEATRAVADLDHRPAVDKPRGDPNAPCRQ